MPRKPTPAAAPAKRNVRNIPSTMFAVADLARELGIDPKIARANLRRNAAKHNLSQGDAGWLFPNTKRDLLKHIIAPARFAAPSTKRAKKVVANATPATADNA